MAAQEHGYQTPGVFPSIRFPRGRDGWNPVRRKCLGSCERELTILHYVRRFAVTRVAGLQFSYDGGNVARMLVFGLVGKDAGVWNARLVQNRALELTMMATAWRFLLAVRSSSRRTWTTYSYPLHKRPLLKRCHTRQHSLCPNTIRTKSPDTSFTLRPHSQEMYLAWVDFGGADYFRG